MDEAPTPLDDYEYPVVLGKSLTETDDEEQNQHVFASFGYEFQPASVDKSTPGLVSVDGSSGVQVLMGSSTGAAGGVSFKGKLVEHKETDCLLIFDGSSFRLERCPFSCMQLRHVRAPTPRQRVKIQSSRGNTADVALVSKEVDTAIASMTGEVKKRPLRRSKPTGSKHSVGLIKAPEAAKRRRGRPKGSTKAAIAAKKARLEASEGVASRA